MDLLNSAILLTTSSYPDEDINVTAASATPKGKMISNKSTRAGAADYTAKKIIALLDIEEQEDALGSIHWAVVANKFVAWASISTRAERDQNLLENKFDKLANTKNMTGHPSYSAPEMRAKLTARVRPNKSADMGLGDSSAEDERETAPDFLASEGTDGTDDGENVIGRGRKKKKKASAGIVTVTRTKMGEMFFEHVGRMTEHIAAIFDSIRTKDSSTVSRSEFVFIVQREIAKSIKHQ